MTVKRLKELLRDADDKLTIGVMEDDQNIVPIIDVYFVNERGMWIIGTELAG